MEPSSKHQKAKSELHDQKLVQVHEIRMLDLLRKMEERIMGIKDTLKRQKNETLS
jgi:hypothetical protein